MNDLAASLRQAMEAMPIADVHSHLGGGGRRQARTLADIASYHWLSKELERAKGGPLKADPNAEPEAYLQEAAALFPAVRNTVNHYAFLGILRELYGFQGRTLTEDNWREADEAVRSHAGDASWVPTVLDRAGVERILVAHRDGMPDETDRYVPYEYAEPLYACRSLKPFEEWSGERPRSGEQLAEAIRQRVAWLAEEKSVRALHVWPPSTWAYRRIDAESVSALVERLADGHELPDEEADLLASFAADVTAEAAAGHGMVIQLFHGATRYTPQGYPASTWNPAFLRRLAPHLEAHGETCFDLFLATRPPSHEAVFLSRSYPNLMVSGAWWHGFTPTTLLTFFRDRLEALPSTAWNAFYSDGYIVEWVYGKLLVTKNRLAHALAGMVGEDFLTEDDALEIAGRVLHDNAVAACGL